MYCQHCGAFVANRNSACPSCDTCVRNTCAKCGFDNLPESLFCAGCADRVASSTDSVNRDNTIDDAGLVKQVTVMFADVSASFALVHDPDPEIMNAQLDAILKVMVNSVHEYGGTVAQVLGDGIMALFGAPKASEHHAVRACYSALTMLRKIDDHDWTRYSKLSAKKGGSSQLAPKIRIGLDSGDVVISKVGSDLNPGYRAVGTTTHMAARMEQRAEPGSALLTPATLKLAYGLIEVTSLGPGVIKGIAEPLETFRLRGRTNLTRFQASTARGLTPFSGRSSELELLDIALQKVLSGGSTVVLLEGEPGIGKSRLLHEFLSSDNARAHNAVLAEGVTFSETPYIVAQRTVRAQLGVSAHGPLAEAEHALQTSLALAPELKPHTAALQSLLNISGSNREWKQLDDNQRRNKLLAAMRALLVTTAMGRPVILVCEDLQWFDNSSFEMLTDIIENPPATLLAVLTQRSSSATRRTLPEFVTHCTLAPLSVARARAFVTHSIGNHPDLQALRDQLVTTAGGNPFFLEETIRSLVDTRALHGTLGHYEPGGSADKSPIPATIDAVINARMDQLPDRHLEILVAAALIEDNISDSLLQAVLDIPQQQLDDATQSLATARLLYADRTTAKRNWHFCHALYRDALNKRLLKANRRKLHAQILNGLERIFADRDDAPVEKLAHHAFNAENWQASVGYHLAASNRATARSGHRYAVTMIDRGLQSLEHLPASNELMSAAIDLRLSGLSPLLVLGDLERLFRVASEAEELARQAGDHHRLGAVHIQLATAYWLTSKHQHSLKSAGIALQVATDHSIDLLARAARHNIAIAHHSLGNFERAADISRKLIDEFSGKLSEKRFGWVGYPSVFCRTFLASSLAFCGKFTEALEIFSYATTLADKLDHPYSRAIIREEHGFCYLLMGNPHAALQVLEESQQICLTYDIKTMIPATSGRLASAMAACGRVTDALELASENLDQKTYKDGGRCSYYYLLIAQSRALLLANRPQEALVPAKKVLSLTSDRKERGYQACAQLVLADVLAAMGADYYTSALESYQETLTLTQQHHIKPLQGLCWQGLGKLHLSHGDPTSATAALCKARALFSELELHDRIATLDDLLEKTG